MANPHLAADRECTVLTLGPSGRLEVVKQRVGEMPVRAKSPMLAVSLYRDTSGLLTTANRLARGRQRLTHRQQELDEEDELLYGGGGKGRTEPGEEPRRGGRTEEAWRRHLEPVPPTYLLVTVRAKGNFELYSLPDFTLCFLAPDFPHLPDVLADATNRRQVGIG